MTRSLLATRGHPSDADVAAFQEARRSVVSRRSASVGNPSRRATGSLDVTRAIFDDVVVADSDDVRVVEGMTYFPVESVDMDALVESPTTSRCFWKGKATYWHVQGRNDIAQNAAFAYQHPSPLARKLVSGRIAFWQGVQIVP